ncbi:MAG: ABC transporter permease, partial [Candidatus Promineifilaceae bacterium]
MLQTEVDLQEVENVERQARKQATVRLLRYSAMKLLALFFTVAIGVYLTVLIANMGGYVDEIRRGQIRESVALTLTTNPEFQKLAEAERSKIMNETIAIQERRYGLDQPFILRSFAYLKDALTLNLGFSDGITSDSGSRAVRNIILERLPSTLVLFGTA